MPHYEYSRGGGKRDGVRFSNDGKKTAECGNLKGGKKRCLDVVNLGESGILFAIFLILNGEELG